MKKSLIGILGVSLIFLSGCSSAKVEEAGSITNAPASGSSNAPMSSADSAESAQSGNSAGESSEPSRGESSDVSSPGGVSQATQASPDETVKTIATHLRSMSNTGLYPEAFDDKVKRVNASLPNLTFDDSVKAMFNESDSSYAWVIATSGTETIQKTDNGYTISFSAVKGRTTYHGNENAGEAARRVLPTLKNNIGVTELKTLTWTLSSNTQPESSTISVSYE